MIPPRACPMGGLPDVGEHNDTPPEERKAQPYTQDDLMRGEKIVRELHGLQGFDAWAERIAKEIAAVRALSRPSRGSAFCSHCMGKGYVEADRQGYMVDCPTCALSSQHQHNEAT